MEQRELTRQEEIAAIVAEAIAEALDKKPAKLGELWLRVEELGGRRDSLKATATKLAAMSKLCDEEAELITSAIMAELVDRKLPAADAGFGKLTRKTNGGQQAVQITPGMPIPPEYTKSKVTTSTDVVKIGAALREGEIMDFACLAPRGEHLSLEAV